MTRFFYLFLIAVATIATSCGNSPKKEPTPRNFDEAFAYGYSDRVFDVPDTLFLGFHWGMSKNDVNNYLKELLQNKTITSTKQGYCYKYPNPIKVGDFPFGYFDKYTSFVLSFDYDKDMLSTLSLTCTNGDITSGSLYQEFDQVFREKGYFTTGDRFIKFDGSMFAWELKDDREYSSRLYVQNNTLIRIYEHYTNPSIYDLRFNARMVYYNLSLIHQGHDERQAAIDAKRQKEEEKRLQQEVEKEKAKRVFFFFFELFV